MSFPCSMCGECCKHLIYVPQLSSFDNGNGVCKYLINNKCSIYDSRPDICRVDLMYEKYYKNIYTLDEFYEMNKKICNKLKKKEV